MGKSPILLLVLFQNYIAVTKKRSTISLHQMYFPRCCKKLRHNVIIIIKTQCLILCLADLQHL